MKINKQNKRSYILFFAMLSVILISSCGKSKESDNRRSSIEDAQVDTNKKGAENLNISFLLDLSDRISPSKFPNETMDYYKRDAAYIKSVAEAFDQHLRTKRVREMNDRIQVFFDPEPQNPSINNISSDLKYVVNRTNASIQLLDSIKEVYATRPLEIYDLAIEDDQYVGSDTWKFFNSKVEDYCIEDGYRNILIILTDGYIYHKDTKRLEGNKTTYLTPQLIRGNGLIKADWEDLILEKEYGFIPAISGLDDLEVLVLGINPDPKNSYEEDVIKYYWKDWFDAMGVKRYSIKNAGLPSNMDKIIKDFVLK